MSPVHRLITVLVLAASFGFWGTIIWMSFR